MCISQVSPVYSKPNGTLDAMIDHNNIIVVIIYSTIITYYGIDCCWFISCLWYIIY